MLDQFETVFISYFWKNNSQQKYVNFEFCESKIRNRRISVNNDRTSTKIMMNRSEIRFYIVSNKNWEHLSTKSENYVKILIRRTLAGRLHDACTMPERCRRRFRTAGLRQLQRASKKEKQPFANRMRELNSDSQTIKINLETKS